MAERYFRVDSVGFDEPLDLTTSANSGSSNHEPPIPITSRLHLDLALADGVAQRNPAQCEQAFGVFVRKLTVEFLDNRLPISQQPHLKLAHIENVCRRAFPQYDARQIRLKIRAQLKLCRRQLKKLSEETKPLISNTERPRMQPPCGSSGVKGPVATCPSVNSPTSFTTRCNGSPATAALSFTSVPTSGAILLQKADHSSHHKGVNKLADPQTNQLAASISQDPPESSMDDGCKENMATHSEVDCFLKFIIPTEQDQSHEAEVHNATPNDEAIRPPNLLASSLRMSAGILMQTAKLFEITGLTASSTSSLRYPSVVCAIRIPRDEGLSVSLGNPSETC